MTCEDKYTYSEHLGIRRLGVVALAQVGDVGCCFAKAAVSMVR